MQGNTDRFLRAAERIFAATDEALVVMDSRFVALALNEAHFRATGYGRSESIGRRSVVADAIEARKRLSRTVLRALSRSGAWEGEILIHHRFHGPRPVHLVIKETSETARGERGYVAVFSQTAPLPAAAGPLRAGREGAATTRLMDVS